MPLYITLSSGPRADQAKPVLVLSDPRAISALLREVGRLGEEEADAAVPAHGVDSATARQARPVLRARGAKHRE